MKTSRLLRSWRIVVFTAAALLASNAANAAKVLYYYDSFAGTDFWAPALSARGDTVTTVTSASALVTQLAAGAPWDVVVVSENGNDDSVIWASSIATYVSGGGRLALNNWYANNVIDTATQAVAGPPVNQTVATINAAGLAAGLATGVVTNPLALSNAGWGVFSQALVPQASAVSYCDFPVGSCAVFGNGGRTIRLGLIPDSLAAADASRFLQNALATVIAAAPPEPVTPVSVPTLSQWGAMLLSVLLGLSALLALRRRRD